jgi:catechol 2,3-dioxygenase-like lactoylglutathione lyase family enzyme
VGFRVADLEKTRAFYTNVLGFQQAFDQKDAAGKTTLAVFKINEEQSLEFPVT